MAKFLTSLSGEWMDDDVRFVLGPDLIYQSDILAKLGLPQFSKGIVTVKSGFVTDFASVPRVPIVYELFGDKSHHESVVHDFGYQTHQGVDRTTWDKVFLEAMTVRGKSAFVRTGMYWGVRLGGWNAYRTGPKRYLQLNPNGGNT